MRKFENTSHLNASAALEGALHLLFLAALLLGALSGIAVDRWVLR